MTSHRPNLSSFVLDSKTKADVEKILLKLPLDTDEADWEGLLQAEVAGKLTRSVFPIDFANGSEEDSSKFNANSISAALSDLLAFHRSKRIFAAENLRSFFESLDRVFASQPSSPLQNLLLLLIEGLFKGDSRTFLHSSEIVLLLSGANSGVPSGHLFSPSAFVIYLMGERLLKPLPSDYERQHRRREQQESSDEEEEGEEMNVVDQKQLIVLLSTWLSSQSLECLRTTGGATAVVAVIEHLYKVMARSNSDELATLCIDALAKFVRTLDKLRLSQQSEGPQSPSSSSPAAPDSTAKIRSTADGIPLLPITATLFVDTLLWGMQFILRLAVEGMVMSERVPGTAIQTIPKALHITRDRCVTLIQRILEAAPTVLHPADLRVLCVPAPRKAAREAEAAIRSSDDEEEGEGTARRRALAPAPRGQQPHKDAKSLNDPLLAFLARCCLAVPDRKEWREQIAAAVVTLLRRATEVENKIAERAGPEAEDAEKADGGHLADRFIKFVAAMLESSKLAARTVAVDVAEALLLPPAFPAGPLGNASAMEKLVDGIARRLSDIQSVVRSKALDSLALLYSRTTDFSASNPLLAAAGLVESQKITRINVPLIICQRASDQKQAVRRSVLSFLFALVTAVVALHEERQSNFASPGLPVAAAATPLAGTAATPSGTHVVERQQQTGESPVESHLQALLLLNQRIFRSLANDSSVQVRLKTISTLQQLLELLPNSPVIRRLWLESVPSAMADTESTVVSRVTDAVSRTIFAPLADLLSPEKFDAGFAAPLRLGLEPRAPLSVLELATVENRGFLHKSFAAICKQQGGSLGVGVERGIQRACEALRTEFSPLEWPQSIMFVLHEQIALRPTAIPVALVHACWDKAAGLLLTREAKRELDRPAGSGGDPRLRSLCKTADALLRMLCLQREAVPRDALRRLTVSLLRSVESGCCPLALIARALRTAQALAPETAGPAWAEATLQRVTGEMTALLQSSARHEVDNCSETPQTTALLSAHSCELEEQLLLLGELTATFGVKLPPRTITLLEAIATGTIAQALEAIVRGNSGKQQQQQQPPGSIPVSVKALATFTLGMALTSREAADSHLIKVLSLLTLQTHPTAVRLTALLAFADAIVRFGSATDSFVPGVLSASLLGAPLIVRKQALSLLASLLAQDYVKGKGYVVFLVAACYADECPVVAELADVTLAQIFLPRQPRFVSNHFIEIVCFLNGCTTHPRVRVAHAAPAFAAARRQKVYLGLLRMAEDRDKNCISKRIVQQFLGAFLDSDENAAAPCPLPADTKDSLGSALSDALRLLGCRQLKISFLKAPAVVEPEEQPATAAASNQSYETDLLKRNLAYEILPTLLSLKKIMESRCSPFLKDLLDCIAGLVYDYKADLSDLLFNDPLLAQQLQAEIRRGAAGPAIDLAVAPPEKPIRKSLVLPLEELSRTGTADGTFTIPRMRTQVSARRSLGDAPLRLDQGAPALVELRKKQRGRAPGRTSLPVEFAEEDEEEAGSGSRPGGPSSPSSGDEENLRVSGRESKKRARGTPREAATRSSGRTSLDSVASTPAPPQSVNRTAGKAAATSLTEALAKVSSLRRKGP